MNFINRDINSESMYKKKIWLDSYLVSGRALQVLEPYVDVCPKALTMICKLLSETKTRQKLGKILLSETKTWLSKTFFFHLHALDCQLPSKVVAVGGTARKPHLGKIWAAQIRKRRKSHPEPVHRARAGPVDRLHHGAEDPGLLHHLVRALLRGGVVVLQHLLYLGGKEPNCEDFLSNCEDSFLSCSCSIFSQKLQTKNSKNYFVWTCFSFPPGHVGCRRPCQRCGRWSPDAKLISKNSKLNLSQRIPPPKHTWELEARTMETGGRELPLRLGLLSIVALAAFFSSSGRM